MKSQIAGSAIAGAAAIPISTSALLLYADKKPSEVRVIDGDTLYVDDTKYRLAGINTPELRTVCVEGKKKKNRWRLDQSAVVYHLC